MASEQDANHWEHVYEGKAAGEVSWFQAHLHRSLALIDDLRLPSTAALIDVGGGASTLVDDWLARGFEQVTVIDLSERALAESRRRLGARADRVRWIVGDATTVTLPESHFDLWHDRAAFHFLTGVPERTRYADQAARAIRFGGHLLVATFALDGPTRCSGLPVERHDAASISSHFSSAFTMVRTDGEQHQTPTGATHSFFYALLRRSR